MSDQSPPPGPYPPQGGQPYGHPMPPPKKSNTLRNVLIGVVVFFILTCGGCLAIVGVGANEVAKEADKAASEAASAGDAPEDEPGTDQNTDKPKASEKTEKAEKPKPKAEWKTVAELSGNTSKAGPDFHLDGCEVRLKYNIKGGDSALVAFYVLDSGTKLMEDGGFPVASPDKSGAGETSLRKDEGDYYIEVVAANADWDAQVQEKC